MKFSSEIIGANELEAKMKEVNSDVLKRGGRASLRKAANHIRDEAKKNARALDDTSTSENIAANVAIRWSSKRYKKTGDLGFRVGVMGGAKGAAKASGEFTGKGEGNPGGDTFYWRFLEFGTQFIPARPFMRPALADNIGAATAIFVREYGKALNRAIKRAKKGKS